MTVSPLRPVPDTPGRVVCYIRVSSRRGRGGPDFHSPDVQRDAVDRHVKSLGCRVAAEVQDIDVSGRSFARAGLDQVRAMVEAGQVDAVALYDLSRLGRNVAEALDFVRWLRDRGVSVISTKERIDDTPTGRFLLTQFLAMAQMYGDQVGKQWSEIHERRVRSGLPATGKPRWGYRYDPASKTFSPDPVTGPVLRDLYQRYTAGEPALALVEWLNRQDIRTSTGGRWERHTLLRMMDSGFGAGLLTWRGDRLPGVHDPVINSAEWAAYQARRVERRRTPSRTKGSTYPLSGLVVCARCEGPMYPGVYRDGIAQYRCATSVKQGRSACRGGYVSAVVLADAARDWLAGLVADTDALAALTEPRRPVTTARVDVGRLRREVARVDTALARLTTAWALGNLGEDELAAARAELVQQRDRAAAQLAAADAVVESPGRPGVGVYRGLLAGWDTMDAAARRDACRVVIRQVRVLTGRPRGVVTVVPRWGDDRVG